MHPKLRNVTAAAPLSCAINSGGEIAPYVLVLASAASSGRVRELWSAEAMSRGASRIESNTSPKSGVYSHSLVDRSRPRFVFTMARGPSSSHRSQWRFAMQQALVIAMTILAAGTVLTSAYSSELKLIPYPQNECHDAVAFANGLFHWRGESLGCSAEELGPGEGQLPLDTGQHCEATPTVTRHLETVCRIIISYILATAWAGKDGTLIVLEGLSNPEFLCVVGCAWEFACCFGPVLLAYQFHQWRVLRAVCNDHGNHEIINTHSLKYPRRRLHRR